MESNLSIFSMETPTREDINIKYNPSSLVTWYKYTIIKNSNKLEPVEVRENKSIDITLTETGTYQIIIEEYYLHGSNKILTGKYNIDKEAPVINIQNKSLKIKQGESVDYMSGVSALDNIDGDVTTSIQTNIKEIDLNKIGSQKITYTVSDVAGNQTIETVNINVIRNNDFKIHTIQLSLLIVAIIFILYIMRYTKSLKYEARLAKYSVKAIKDKNKTLFDGLIKLYNKIIYSLDKVLNKSYFIKEHSRRYQKYIAVFGNEDDNPTVFTAKKICMSALFIMISIISKALRSEMLRAYEMIVPLFVGYYFLDIIYEYNYRKYRKQVENDFLQAIIIMNNAFKSGRSITQAIDLVSMELRGPIAEEFKKISLEISFGLDIEVVFKRLADRVKLDEAIYLTTSLAITNRTGGNITKLFSSIEKNLFNRRKLNLELKSLTGSSKIVIYVLALVPVLFVGIIELINPSYFVPMFSSPLGLILVFIMIIIYIMYIYVIRRIVNIRM